MGFRPVFSGRLIAAIAQLGPRLLAFTAVWVVLQSSVFAQAHRISSADSDLVETGAPAFAVLGGESLGLDSSPTDIRLMPDGRILVVAAQQLALGDGVRWQVYRQAPSDPIMAGIGAAVDEAGRIYVGTSAGAARVEFGDDGFWRLSVVEPWSAPTGSSPRTFSEVMVTVSGTKWYWHSLTGAVMAWRPGETARMIGQANTFEGVFELGDSTYISDRSNGSLVRVGRGEPQSVKATGSHSAITCAQDFDAQRVLVGTYGLGLQLFDGQNVQDFPAGGALSNGSRINALCATDGGFFAAAVDNFGIVFFDRTGRTIQSLDRSMDQRLARVKRLVPAPGGVIWALIDGGILHVEFPSPVSYFESMIGTGVTTVHPFRINSRLWLLADGKAYRGEYNPDRQLSQLTIDSPAKLFVNSLSGAMGLPVVGTENGAYYRDEAAWVPFAPTIQNLRIVDSVPVSGRWLYTARNEVGWLQLVNGAVVIAERIPVPELDNAYNTPVKDGQGRIWLELGIGRVASVQVEQGRPTVRLLTVQDGLLPTWPQIFIIDGKVGFNLADNIFQYDEVSRRVVPDPGLVGRLPGITNVFGRPGLDAGGRLWVAADGAVQCFQKQDRLWVRQSRIVSLGFLPYFFTFEAGGPIWMHAQHRLARYDPAIAESPSVPLRARITQINVASSNRSLFSLDRELAPLSYSENSLIAHFVASGNSFATRVSFEVMLEGSASEWISAGSGGSAAFSRLKEGRYVLHVRPRSGSSIGTEATLAFSILPPWYRTTFAYLAYVVSAIGFVLLAAWLSTLLERRENARLEHLVAERTGELSQSNLQLASQVEEIRILTQAITQSPIAIFITSPEGNIEFTNPRSCELTGFAATALIGSNLRQLRAPEVTPQVLEEISAVLQRGDSWNGQLANCHQDGRIVQVRCSISPILSPDGRTRHHLIMEEDITDWLAEQQRSRRLEAQLTQAQKMESIGTLAGGIAHDFNNILTGILGYCELAKMAAEENGDVRTELQQIRTAGLRAKDLVMQILTFSRQSHTKLVPLQLARPVAEALKLIRASIPSTIEIFQNLEAGRILADATQIHQIIVNLCTNAVHAMRDRPGRLEVTIRNITADERLAAETPNLKPGPCLKLRVADNGRGMDQPTLERIFDPFFTTKLQGEGTGLGLAIVQGVVVGHGGALQVSSQLGVGTTFDLYFPRTETSESKPDLEKEPARGAGEEIMVVDDEPAIGAFASSRLQHFGYRPVLFNDPRLALETFNAAPGRFAALVTDLTMPQLTGLDLIDQLRPLRPSLPVVVLTGYGREHTREKLAALPHCILLPKPFSGEDLAHALGQVLRQANSIPKSGDN